MTVPAGLLPPPPIHPMATKGFKWYLDRLARRQFATVRWRSEADWLAWDPAMSTLVVANHTSWWDGFLSHQLTVAMGHGFRILMQADNLARYPFFRRVGALPIDRRSRPQSMRDLAHAVRTMQPGTMLWIYPQGSRRPAGEPIGKLEAGAAWLINRHAGPLRVVPVAFRYPFVSEQHPDAMISVGAPWITSGVEEPRASLTDRLRNLLALTVADLDQRLATETFDDFVPLITGRESINNRLDRVRHALGLLPDYQVRNG